jgi:hypothetical protein
VNAKARLPLVANQHGARAPASAGPAQPQACVVRAASGRALVYAIDDAGGEAALRFASGVLERIQLHGVADCASLSSEALHAGAAHLDAWLTVRIGARAGRTRSDECDLEVARDDGLIATLIGDWVATHIQDVSAKARATSTKNPRA